MRATQGARTQGTCKLASEGARTETETDARKQRCTHRHTRAQKHVHLHTTGAHKRTYMHTPMLAYTLLRGHAHKREHIQWKQTTQLESYCE